jgi:hypothetical protein
MNRSNHRKPANMVHPRHPMYGSHYGNPNDSRRTAMRSGFSAADTQPSAGGTLTTKEIPYDYVAKFKLQGKPGNRVQDVINISVEGGFVAVAIGYSFIPTLPVTLPLPAIVVPRSDDAVPPTTTTLVEIIASTIAGALTLGGADQKQTVGQLATIIQPFVDSRILSHCLLTRVCGIEFKYSIVDSGTGRELQNQPIHNIAGLGESTGERPFRPFAKPMLFLPRSTIRIEVEEISAGPIYTGAELFIVLHGYKMLGYGTALP